MLQSRHSAKSSTFTRRLLYSTAGAIIAVAAHPALAQEQPESTPSNDSTAREQGKVDEIVVTAQKRPERQVEAPVTVTVVNSDRIEQLGAKDLKDIAAFVPGLTYASSGSSEQIILRGVSQGTSYSPLVAIVVDGASIGSSTGLALGGIFVPHLNLADVERVEVLSGPQSTLYGASSMGGVISYVTKSGLRDPLGGSFYAEGSGTEHGQGNYLIRGAVNVPLATDVAALRVSGFYQHDGAFLDNSLSGQMNVNRLTAKGGRVSLALAPTSGLTIKLSANIEQENRSSSDTVVYRFAPPVPLVSQFDQGHLLLQPSRRNYQVYTGNVNWNLGPVVLDSITAYSRVHSNVVTEATASPFGAFLTGFFGANSAAYLSKPTTKKFSQELRLTSPNSTGFRWMAGLYYAHEDSIYDVPIVGYDANNDEIPSLDPAYRFIQPSTLTTYAAFANVTVPLTSRLEITGGIRHTHDKHSSSSVASGPLEPLFGGTTATAKTSEDHLDFLATARYQLAKSTYAYARVASGFRPGGSNAAVVGVPPTFGPDKLVNYEAGLKTIFADGRAAIEVAAFHIDWSDIQIQSFANGFGYFANTGRAKVDGIELSGRFVPLDGLTLTGNLAYTDARLSKDAPSIGGIQGEQLPNTAKFGGSLTGEYKHELSTDLSGIVGANYAYIGKRRASFDASVAAPQFVLPHYSMLNVHAGLEWGRYRLTAFVRNLLDVRGLTSAQTGFGLADVGITRPRTFGLQLSAEFSR